MFLWPESDIEECVSLRAGSYVKNVSKQLLRTHKYNYASSLITSNSLFTLTLNKGCSSAAAVFDSVTVSVSSTNQSKSLS